MNSEGEFWIHLKLSFWFDWFVQEIIQKLDQNVGTASVDHNTADSSSVETADVAKKVMMVLPKKWHGGWWCWCQKVMVKKKRKTILLSNSGVNCDKKWWWFCQKEEEGNYMMLPKSCLPARDAKNAKDGKTCISIELRIFLSLKFSDLKIYSTGGDLSGNLLFCWLFNTLWYPPCLLCYFAPFRKSSA